MNLSFFYLNYYFLDFCMMFIILIPSNLYKFHPLIFSILLFFFSIILSLKLNYLMMNFYYSYILFLVMIGGVMILIMYFTSISSNELLIFSKNFFKFYFIKQIFYMMFIFLVYKLYMKNYFMNLYKNFELLNLNSMNLDNLNFYILKNLYMDLHLEITIFFIMYLLLMMMFSTMICLKFNIPMRQLIN
uniref:NADH dehydrogenase subunit 6 n=1 Tax=Microgaster sp. SNS-2016 TaxID=1911510 RepID=A0A6F8AL42_9HYME|nr:NADH dehydrogenase subunit 6 [Microgaster sp. SNS-2016]